MVSLQNFKKIIISICLFLVSVHCSRTAEPEFTEPDEPAIIPRNGTIHQVTLRGESYPFDHADYSVFIPEGVTVRGLLILQHGCGMEQFGITRPYDLQYQAFAKKWDLAILETALYGNCGGWKDANSGSATALLKALDELADLSGHHELCLVPWLLWGHSGGGYWVLSMIQAYTERTLAAFCYSPAWEIPNGNFPEKVKDIPVFIRHAGSGEAPEGGTNCCWASSIKAFSALRELDAPASIAYTAGQNHNFSFVRHMAIPFFEAVLKQRLPEEFQTEMKPLDRSQTWLADTLNLEVFRESEYAGLKRSMCLLPDSVVAAKWKEYVNTGDVADNTAPPAPYDLQMRCVNDSVEISWRADADIESGIKQFNICRNGVHIGQLPESGTFQTFDTNGDNTIPKIPPRMKFMIAIQDQLKTIISVSTVNHFNLKSEEATIECNGIERRLLYVR